MIWQQGASGFRVYGETANLCVFKVDTSISTKNDLGAPSILDAYEFKRWKTFQPMISFTMFLSYSRRLSKIINWYSSSSSFSSLTFSSWRFGFQLTLCDFTESDWNPRWVLGVFGGSEMQNETKYSNNNFRSYEVRTSNVRSNTWRDSHWAVEPSLGIKQKFSILL